MKIFDSLKTINYCHALMKQMTQVQKYSFMDSIHVLFDKKQISEEGEYSSFLITEKDLVEIASLIQQL